MNQLSAWKFFSLVLLFTMVTGCDQISKGGGSGSAVGFVVTSNFSVGNLSTVTTTDPREVTPDILGSTGIHSDSVIRVFGGLVYILQRFGSNSIVVIDPADPSSPIANYTTNDLASNPPQSNPVDMEFVSSSKAYVSRQGLNTILIVDPITGDQLGTIDLSMFADSDGLVEMDQMVIVNGLLYISLQRLDQDQLFGEQAANDSFVVVIDTDTDQIVDLDSDDPGNQAIVLQGRNPFHGMVYLASTNRIYLTTAGNFNMVDNFGGIEVLDPDTMTTEGFIFTDNQLGGTVGSLAVLNDVVAYATILTASFENFVVPFSLSSQKIDSPLTGMSTSFIPSLALDPFGFLYVADQDFANPGLQVFDTMTNEKVEGPLDTGLPPFEIAFVN